MNDMTAPTILIVPGLRDHVPEHWQTLLEQKLPNATSRAADGARQAVVRGVGRASSTDRWRAIDGPGRSSSRTAPA